MTTGLKPPSGKDEVVGALLDAADRLFAASGPADVSLRAIAREAGVNHGLVHRYFGTRDDLVNELLKRMANDWTAQIQATGDFTTALGSILGNPGEAEASAGSWLRLLAWSMLTEPAEQSGEAQRRFATLDLLPGMLDDANPDDKAETVAVSLALAFGWRFVHPYIRAALHLEDKPFADVHNTVRVALERTTKS
jgi:AcrR family transcriptional regulator